MKISPKILYFVLFLLPATIICDLAFGQSGSWTTKALQQVERGVDGSAALPPGNFISVPPGLSNVFAPPNIGTEIVNLASQKCLDVASGSIAAGADVNQFGCHEGPNQKWLAHKASTPGYVYFENQNSHLCLDIRIGGPKNGTLQQNTCHYGDNQLFRLERFADSVGGIRIVAKHSGQCLDVPSGRSEDRLFIQQFSCHLGPSQRWIYADNGPYSFQISANPIGRYTLTLQAGSAYSFSLGNLPAGVAPFMHLWRSKTAGNVTPLGQNGPAARVPILNYVVPFGKEGTYTLFVHGPPGVGPGTASLTIRQNNVELYNDLGFPIGGTMIDVPDSTGPSQFRYETAEVPGGVTNTFILALDDSNRLTGFNDDSGTGLSARISGQAGTSRIVVSSFKGYSGPAMLYANDIFQDNDRDGLGYGLERELGTCDMKNAQPKCASVFNPQDTDRDGIEDGVEVLGVRDGALYFPRWGANPLHKDLFIEADWTSEFNATPLNQERIRQMRNHLAGGPAAHLDNPDGLNGIAMHVDAGIDPTDSRDRTLYGAWGGANQVPLAVWQAGGGAPPAGSFDSRRLPYFRQLLLLAGGGSNGPGRFWYATGTDPDTIMHEFGHTLGLEHEGVIRGPNGPVLAGVNCSPAYPSIMSYGTPAASFLTGDGFPPGGINPSSLCEADGLGSGITDLSFITNSLGGIPVDSPGKRIDWNRDLTYSGTAPLGSASRCLPSERVRAVINWGFHGCDAHIKGFRILSPEVASAGRRDSGDLLGAPALTRVGSRLYLFYVKRNASGAQSLFYQSALIGPKSTAGCTDGFKVYSDGHADPCMRFAGPYRIELSLRVREFLSVPIVPSRVAVHSYGDGLQVAIVNASAQIRTFTVSAADLEAGRDLQIASTDALGDSSGSMVTTSSDLSFAEIGVDRVKFGGTGRHLALYYVDRAGAVRWASKEYGPARGFIDHGAVLDGQGAPLITAAGDSPAIASWNAVGKGNLELYFGNLELYMALQRQDGKLRLYRYDRAPDRWRNITQAVFGDWAGAEGAVQGPGHNQKIAFWFQHILNGNGEIIRPGSGFFSILFRNQNGQDPTLRISSLWRSENVSQTLRPSQSLHFQVFQQFGHDWFWVREGNFPLGLGGGYAVYSDETMPGLKAALLKRKSPEEPLYDLAFLTLADGIFDMDFKPSSDFKVMEATLCRAMRGEVFCGTPAQTKWGF